MSPKRKAAATPPRLAKRSKKRDPVGYRVEKIEHVLGKSENAIVSSMLQSCCVDAFKADSESRGDFEAKAIDMIRDAIQDIRVSRLEDQQKKQRDRESADDEKNNVKQKLETLQNQLTAKKADLKGACGWEATKQLEVETAVAEQKNFAKSAKMLSQTEQRARETVKQSEEAYAQVAELRSGGLLLGAKERKKAFAAFLQPLLKRMRADESLMSAAPTAYVKATADRGAFDQAAIDSVDQLYTNYIQEARQAEADLQPQVESSNVEGAELERRVQSVKTVLEDATKEVAHLAGDAADLGDIIADLLQREKEQKRKFSAVEQSHNDAFAELQVVEEALGFISELVTRVGGNLVDAENEGE